MSKQPQSYSHVNYTEIKVNQYVHFRIYESTVKGEQPILVIHNSKDDSNMYLYADTMLSISDKYISHKLNAATKTKQKRSKTKK